MTVEDKKLRKMRRCEKRRRSRQLDSSKIKDYILEEGLTFSQAKSQYRNGYFFRYGEKVQVCDYEGVCSYPCNGDC